MNFVLLYCLFVNTELMLISLDPGSRLILKISILAAALGTTTGLVALKHFEMVGGILIHFCLLTILVG